MKQDFESVHLADDNGNPAGGTSTATGIEVTWQNGPLGRDADRIEPNGAFVETVIAIAHDRIEYYETAGFGCSENRNALFHLEAALEQLNARTARREQEQIEGTHEKGSGDDNTGPMSDEQRERFEADAARITEQNTKTPDAGLD